MLTVKEAADKLGVSPSLVYQLCKERKLRHCRIGLGRGKVLIPEEAIEDFLKSSEVTPDPMPSARYRHIKI